VIHALPRRPVNDNEERQYWTCFKCNNGAFLLEWVRGQTTIKCATCWVDVTQHVVPELSQCQP
jgi:LSD1 subclass zinc finger protein